MPLLNFDPGIRAPTARDFESTAINLGNAIGNLPTNYMRAQEDAFALRQKQQLAALFPNGLPTIYPGGPIDRAAVADALAKAGQPLQAINQIPDVQEQYYQRQIQGGDAPSAPWMSESEELVIWMSRIAVKAPRMAAATASQSVSEAFCTVASGIGRTQAQRGEGRSAKLGHAH